MKIIGINFNLLDTLLSYMFIFAILNAQVAKLVNVAVSEAVGVISLRVRVSPWAPVL